jgi:hypothetical protein
MRDEIEKKKLTYKRLKKDKKKMRIKFKIKLNNRNEIKNKN